MFAEANAAADAKILAEQEYAETGRELKQQAAEYRLRARGHTAHDYEEG